MQAKALYPGTFDPPTNGHLDLIQRGARIFGHLTGAILNNPGENPLLRWPNGWRCWKKSFRPLENVSVASFDGQMVEFARQQGQPRFCAASALSPTTNMSSRWP